MEPRTEPRRASPWVALRAVLWSTIFAGAVGAYFPWRFFGADPALLRLETPVHVLGLLVLGAGVALVVAAIVEFVRTGRGTPAPIDAPRELVARGPYRFVRNPMYVGMFTILCGEALLFDSRPLLGYAVGWLVFIHLFVVGYEEPTLRARFGDSYERYTERVGRWWPSLRMPDEGH